MKHPTRRKFLMVSAGLGAALSAGGAGWLLSRELGSDGDPRRKLNRFSRTSRALGTDVSITVLHESEAVAQQAIDAAFDELEIVESVMSIYRPDSELSRLNDYKELVAPHPYLVQVLQHAQCLSQASDGAFDVTVQPLWDSYAAALEEGALPHRREIEIVRFFVDWRRVEVLSGRIRLDSSTSITLNGIAQGFAADQALEKLREHGVAHALVDAGELAPVGQKEDAGPWTAGIQHPRQSDAYLAVARLDGRCLATSGDYATSFSPDRQYNHIFDPRTGYSPTELSSVSVVAPTAMQADGLSTAVFVLGVQKGRALIESLSNVDALFVRKDGRVVATAGFPQEV